MFILICVEGRKKGLMVAKRGRKNSYTNSIKHARKYETMQLAIIDSCGNEEPKQI